MKINRLIEIVILLLNKEVVTASQLAERFDVSTRTIYRDIEALSLSGIPVYMSQGTGGGISLLEDYCVNKAYLSAPEKENLMMALQSMKATSYIEIEPVMEKLRSLFKDESSEDWLQIDLSSWKENSKETLYFNTLKQAIIDKKVVHFNYINSGGVKSFRIIEPLKLMYKGQAWYLHGFCKEKQEVRTFKLSRINELDVQKESFISKQTPLLTKEKKTINAVPNVNLKLKFTSEALYRLYDEFDANQIVYNEDGTYVVTLSYPENDWLYGYILSFGNYVTVLEPFHIREIIIKKLHLMLSHYVTQ